VKKLVTKESVTIPWLEHNGYAIKMPDDTVTKIVVSGFLYRQVQTTNQVNVLLAVTDGVSRSMLYDYRKEGFAVPLKLQGRKREVEDKIQELKIIDKTSGKNSKFAFQFSVKELSDLKSRPTISIEKAVQIREDLLIEQEKKVRKYDSVEEIEKVSLDICQTFASGRITIYESCNRFNVAYLDFFKWVVGNENVRLMYEDSIHVAKFVTESQIYTISTNMILERLKSGYSSNTDVVYDYIWVNGKREEIEKSKKTYNKEITISDLIRVVQLLKNELSAPEGSGTEDFETMSDEELMEYVGDLRKRINDKNRGR